MKQQELPFNLPAAYYRAHASRQRQGRRFRRTSAGQLILVVGAAFFGSFVWDVGLDVSALLGVAALMAAAGLRVNEAVRGYERKHHDSEAVAESVLSLAWRFACGGSPFGIGEFEGQKASEFEGRVAAVEATLPDQAPVAGVKQQGQHPAALRSKSLDERQDIYLNARMRPQQQALETAAEKAASTLGRWNVSLVALEILGTAGALLRVVGLVDIDLLGLAGAGIAAIGAWTRVKHLRETKTKHLDASSELARRVAAMSSITSEPGWAGFVDSTEELILAAYAGDTAALAHVARRSSYDIEKVAGLHWERLSPEERDRLYVSFLQYSPRLHTPEQFQVSEERQESLEQLQPILLTPLERFVTALGLSASAELIRMPKSPSEVANFRDLSRQVIDLATGISQEPLSDALISSTIEVYDYLSCRREVATRDQEQSLDVIVVPGSRNALRYRVDEANRAQSQSRSRLLILSGGKPSYESDGGDLPITEAEAMFHYLQGRLGRSQAMPTIALENRATNTLETAIHTLPHLGAIAHELGRKVNVGLVTSPYHMRRLAVTFSRVTRTFGGAVEELRLLLASTTIDLQLLLDESGDPQRRQFAFQVYLQEYLKLIGGRIVGEF